LCSSNCKNQFDQNPGKYGYWKAVSD
jgi:YHS domain-containing protein